MIYGVLKGGLGNMLFQFCAGYAFARDNNTDLSFPNFKEHLKYLNEDQHFNPSLKHAEEYEEIFKWFPFRTNPPNESICNVNYFPFEYIPNIPANGDGFVGFFQSEKYFKKYRNELISILEPKGSIKTQLNSEINKLPEKYNAVHVRLGDYMKNPNYHTNLPFSYYKTAIENTESELPWVIFSDSVDICKREFTGNNYYFSESARDYLDVYLMANSENMVISNSSFGWWGAWIGEGKMKTITSPDPNKWFGPTARLNTKDVIPDRWRKLSV